MTRVAQRCEECGAELVVWSRGSSGEALRCPAAQQAWHADVVQARREIDERYAAHLRLVHVPTSEGYER